MSYLVKRGLQEVAFHHVDIVMAVHTLISTDSDTKWSANKRKSLTINHTQTPLSNQLNHSFVTKCQKNIYDDIQKALMSDITVEQRLHDMWWQHILQY